MLQTFYSLHWHWELHTAQGGVLFIDNVNAITWLVYKTLIKTKERIISDKILITTASGLIVIIQIHLNYRELIKVTL